MRYQNPIKINISHYLYCSHENIAKSNISDYVHRCGNHLLISLQKGEAISQFHGYCLIVEIKDTKIKEWYYQCIFEGDGSVAVIAGLQFTCHSDHLFSEQLAQNHIA